MSATIDRWPVIVGVGESRQRSKDLRQALEPLELMAQALAAAQADAGCVVLPQVDKLCVIQEFSWPYADAPTSLAERLGMPAKAREYGPVGGETPVRFLHECALAIARGEAEVAAVVGAEAQYSVNAARAQGVQLPWSARDDETPLVRGAVHQHPLARQLGVATPATAYPLFEQATQAKWGLTPAQAQGESAQLWASLSAAAAANPMAWDQRRHSAEEIAHIDANNRLIAWPYPLRMVANPAVNLGAGFLLTSRAQALAWGIAPERLIHVMMGAHASDPANFMARDDLARAHGQEAVLDAVRAFQGPKAAWSHVELYSCFPVVPKLAKRRLQLPPDQAISCTGGLSFFGAPLNNYMSHAVAAMVRQMRQAPGGPGLLFGQGGYMTKHHAVVLGHAPGDSQRLDGGSVQSQADAQRAPPPELAMDHVGPARVESHTVLFARDGRPTHGVVVLRTPDARRLIARVDADDRRSMTRLMAMDASAVGADGQVTTGADGVPCWQLTTA